MNRSDQYIEQELEGFFNEMKKKDEQLAIPPFQTKNRSRLKKLIPVGIAASLLFMAWLYMGHEPDHTLEHDTVIITLEHGADDEYYINLKAASAIDIWESPTSSLLSEF